MIAKVRERFLDPEIRRKIGAAERSFSLFFSLGGTFLRHVGMKDKKSTSSLQRILVNCGAQAKDYGSCVAAKLPEVERDMCLKEFLALKNCNLKAARIAQLNMVGEASSSQSNISLSGAGALSHVYIQYPPLRCNIPGSKGLYYDDGNKFLLSATTDQVFAWNVSPMDPTVTPSSQSISEGPVLSIRYSLDAKILAVQRSKYEIQFWNNETGETFRQRCRAESETILGFFWTDCPTCDIVLVKTSGLDLLTYDPELKNLRLIESKRMAVTWYVYTHESRLVLLASGMQCKSINGFQLSSAGVIGLPKFEMVMAKSDLVSKPILDAKDIHIITVYGRIYCLQVDRVAMLLHLYRFYRDAVVQQGSLSIYSSQIAISVVDNVLLVHQVDAKVVILYDIFADSRAPISAPLPLLLRGYQSANSLSFKLPKKDDGISEARDSNDDEFALYGDYWTFHLPDVICDTANALLWKIHLDLEAISASNSEVSLVLEFLQRRKSEANKAKQLCLDIVRTVILEHRPVPVVARAMEVLLTSYSYAIKTGSIRGMKHEKAQSSITTHVNATRSGVDDEKPKFDQPQKSGTYGSVSASAERSISSADEMSSSKLLSSSLSQLPRPSSSQIDSTTDIYEQDSQITLAAISPDEIYRFVFAVVDEETTGDPTYLVSIIVEFLRSANHERIKVHPILFVLMTQLLARSEQYAELGLFITNKIIEPSKEVAYQLLESGRQNLQTRKLGMEMLRHLCLHHDYILSLVQDGYYLEALRFARKNKVTAVRPSLFLEAAYASNEPQHLAAVLRFFSDFIPDFRTTSEHAAYCELLTQMNSPVVA